MDKKTSKSLAEKFLKRNAPKCLMKVFWEIYKDGVYKGVLPEKAFVLKSFKVNIQNTHSEIVCFLGYGFGGDIQLLQIKKNDSFYC